MLAPPAGPEVITLGCRLNIAESESIRERLGSRDIVVVNSCAVTNEAVRATRAAIRKARRARPHAELVVTGCAATIDPAGFGAMAEVDRVVSNLVKSAPESWNAHNLLDTTGIFSSGHSRAFVEVQNGCDHACTFCAIPAGRGASRSIPAGAVVERIAALLAAGHREVVLTGVDVTSYGPDLPGAPTLGMLVERVLKLVPGLARLRLSSLDGIEIDERLFELLTGEPRVMPHVHLSLQAGDDMILKRMKRRHNRAQSVALVERLKSARPGIAIGADVIAGFPTEDEAMFANTLALIDDCDIVHAHIFPYSARNGTPAARMPQVGGAEIKVRAARLRDAAGKRRAAWLETLVDTKQDVLIERPGDRGHAGNFAEVRFDTPAPSDSRASTSSARTGEVVSVIIERVEDGKLIGKPA